MLSLHRLLQNYTSVKPTSCSEFQLIQGHLTLDLNPVSLLQRNSRRRWRKQGFSWHKSTYYCVTRQSNSDPPAPTRRKFRKHVAIVLSADIFRQCCSTHPSQEKSTLDEERCRGKFCSPMPWCQRGASPASRELLNEPRTCCPLVSTRILQC